MPATGQSIKGTLAFVESATGVLRVAPAGTLAAYYTGSLPFILGLLYFQSDMSRNPFAASHCAAAALALGGLFVWMKCWQAIYLLKVQAHLNQRPPPVWSFRMIARLVALQVIIQPSGLFLLPLALMFALPFGWVYAFYQSVLISGLDSPGRIGDAVKGAWREAAWQPVQNHLLLGVYFFFGLFVTINIGAGMILIPLTLKTFFDIDTLFSMSAMSMLNTTFLFTTAAVTYLCLDPLMKISYALRGFHGSALKTGADLLAELRGSRQKAKIMTVAALLFVGLGSDGAVWAAAGSNRAATEPSQLTATALDESIETVMGRREFTWRMPRKETDPEISRPGFIKDSLEWLAQQIEAVAEMFTYLEKLADWLKKLLPEFDRDDELSHDRGFSMNAQALFTLFLVLLAGIFCLWLLRRMRAARQLQPEDPVEAPRVRPDISDENVQADQLPSDQWLSLAEELAVKGEYRLALRALYLCSLSYLGETRLISIARYKSNFEYQRELIRRAHSKRELQDLFQQNLLFFEKVWYGRHTVNNTDVDLFRDRYERIVECAQ